MKRLILAACALIVCSGISGCGSSADSLMKDQIDILNKIADAMEDQNPQAKLEELAKKLQENAKKMEALKPTQAEMKKLNEKYGPELQKAMQKWIAAMQKNVSKVTNLKFDDIMKNLGGKK